MCLCVCNGIDFVFDVFDVEFVWNEYFMYIVECCCGIIGCFIIVGCYLIDFDFGLVFEFVGM